MYARGAYLLNEVPGEVARVEGGRDEDFGLERRVSISDGKRRKKTDILEVLLEDAVGALFVVGDDVFVALRLEPGAEAELWVIVSKGSLVG